MTIKLLELALFFVSLTIVLAMLVFLGSMVCFLVIRIKELLEK
jgi:hypothetical protein